MHLLTTLRAKLDIYKLEQRYTRREKRTTFCSHAQYVDGEYIYAHPTGGSSNSGSRNTNTTGGGGGGGYPSTRPQLSSTKSATSFGSAATGASSGIKNLGKRASRIFS